MDLWDLCGEIVFYLDCKLYRYKMVWVGPAPNKWCISQYSWSKFKTQMYWDWTLTQRKHGKLITIGIWKLGVPYNKESTHEATNKSPTSWSRLWLSWCTLSPFLRGSSWCPWVPAGWPRRLEVTPSTRRQRSCPLRKCLCNEHALWMVSTLQPIANSYINIINYLLRFRMVLDWCSLEDVHEK